MNFGAFVTPENNILFDVNDFDETLPGVDFTVDLMRPAGQRRGCWRLCSCASKRQARVMAAATVRAYRLHMMALTKLSPLEIWHSRIDLEKEINRIGNGSLRRRLSGVIAKARGEGLSKDDNFPHLVSGDNPKIVDKPPMIFHLSSKADARHKLDVQLCALRVSERAQSGSPTAALLLTVMKDLAFKAVGVGSVGTFCCVGLFLTGDNEPLFLQIKQAQKSVLERLGGQLEYKGHQGRRVVQGQQMMQAASDIFLGYTQDDASGRQFYVLNAEQLQAWWDQ